MAAVCSSSVMRRPASTTEYPADCMRQRDCPANTAARSGNDRYLAVSTAPGSAIRFHRRPFLHYLA